MNRRLFYSLLIGAAALAMGCSGAGNGSSNTAASAGVDSLNSTEAVSMAEATDSSLLADSANVTDPSAQAGSFDDLSFPVLDSLTAPAQSCVSKNVVSSAPGDLDVIFTFACAHLQGDVEIKAGNGSFEFIGNTTTTDGSGYSRTGNSDIKASKTSDGSLNFSKNYDENFVVQTVDIDLKGQASTEIVPDDATMPRQGGKIQHDGQLLVTKGDSASMYSVTTDDLHYSSCGFDSGSIELKGPKNDVVITYSACGSRTITINGQPAPKN